MLHHPKTKKILEHFPKAKRIIIDHYKDIFCRSGQDYEKQHCAQKLILAAKHGALLYEGAPVCQSFGNQNFYYTSCVMNCVYDCEYCYLKGMYPSGNLVIFVNLEDIFEEVTQKLKEHSMYVCVSYDADLLAMEPITGYVAEWNTFVEEQNRIQPGQLRIEVRTKCADSRIFEKIAANSGVIWAFTLSPQQIIDDFEHRTPSLKQRLSCAAEAMKKGFPVRLCFDPMLYCKDWKKQYEEMLYQVAEMMDMERLVDVSVGTFRVSQEYLKKMRKGEPDSAVVQFPYQNDGGVCHYPTALMEEMEGYLVRILENWLPAERIFRWQNEEE